MISAKKPGLPMPSSDRRRSKRPAATVYIVSDGSGRTCEHVVKAALVQFRDHKLELILKSNVRTAKQAAAVVEEAARRRAPLFYTMVAAAPRKAIAQAAAKRQVTTVDVLAPALDVLEDLLQLKPQGKPGLYYLSQKEYFDRLVAVEYTLHHDDGQRLADLRKADVVLVGLSRVSKSATCFVLAYNGIRAANVPLIPGQPLAAELLRLDRRRVIGLTMNAQRLQQVREVRTQAMGVGVLDTYTDRRQILSEIHAAASLMARHHWRTLDVSHRSIEETAEEVKRMIRAE